MPTSLPASAIAEQPDQTYESCLQHGLRYAAALLRNRSDAEEAVQETFCRLHRAGQGGEAGYRGRIFATLRNHFIDLIRRQLVLREVAMHAAIDQSGSGPAHMLESDEAIAALENAIDQLPPDWQQALQLRAYAELGYDEIASVMGVTRNQVRTWIYRARRQLEDCLTTSGILESVTN